MPMTKDKLYKKNFIKRGSKITKKKKNRLIILTRENFGIYIFTLRKIKVFRIRISLKKVINLNNNYKKIT